MAQTKSKDITVYLGDLKPQWIAHCKQQNIKPGAILKKAVEAELNKSANKQHKQRTKTKTVEPKKKPDKIRQTFLMTQNEKVKAIVAAKKSGTTLRGWIVDVVRAALTVDPQFTMNEIIALGESNYQLKMIGINLNQIAKHLNQDPAYKPNLSIIKDITREVNKNIEHSSTLIRSSVERWNIK